MGTTRASATRENLRPTFEWEASLRGLACAEHFVFLAALHITGAVVDQLESPTLPR